MQKTTFDELLDAGVHFGHLKRKWNPNMAPYIFMERNGIHIIDLHKTLAKLDEAGNAMKQIAKSGRKILFVATKKQAKDIVAERIKKISMPYVTERWPGGMLTNFPTIRKAVKKMTTIDKMASDGTFDNLSKRERLQITRQRSKLEKNLGSIADLTRLPAALFVVDILKESIAVREANRLAIPVFGIVDTNTDPTPVDFIIPANDDASKSIALIVNVVASAIEDGLAERKVEKESESVQKEKRTRTKKETAVHSEIKVLPESEIQTPVPVQDEESKQEKDKIEEPEEKKVKHIRKSPKKSPAKKIISKKEITKSEKDIDKAKVK
ncbi:MAG: 30S ribosomal protein S2 [Bacteroidia bacterium]|nr:30S ribosomal protein S2 [Bacteroidia bacterium]